MTKDMAKNKSGTVFGTVQTGT